MIISLLLVYLIHFRDKFFKKKIKKTNKTIKYIRIKTMKYKINFCIYAYLHNLCKLVIFFITIKNINMMNYIILKYFNRKT